MIRIPCQEVSQLAAFAYACPRHKMSYLDDFLVDLKKRDISDDTKNVATAILNYYKTKKWSYSSRYEKQIVEIAEHIATTMRTNPHRNTF